MLNPKVEGCFLNERGQDGLTFRERKSMVGLGTSFLGRLRKFFLLFGHFSGIVAGLHG